MDGNVRRVLSRWFGIEGEPTDRATTQLLWSRAEECTPQQAVAAYTQAIMDMGATLCTRRNPLCLHCPVAEGCSARHSGRQHELPTPKSKRAVRPARHTHMVLALRPDGSVFLRQRPPAGIWGGLWAAPAFDSAVEAKGFAGLSLGGEPIELPAIQHAFTHFDLTIIPWLVRCQGPSGVMDAPGLWYNARHPASIGLPAPMKTLLERLEKDF
jgi:A/G-specific adenine glycosylase